MPLVIYGLGGVHTHTHADESDYKKPGVRRAQAGAPGLKRVWVHETKCN